MVEQYYSPKDNTDFPQIVLKYIDKILDILSKELKNKQTIIHQIGSRAEIVLEEEDTRQSFVQSIQALTSLLAPWHDKDMESSSEEFTKIVDGTRAKYHKEYKKQVEEELVKIIDLVDFIYRKFNLSFNLMYVHLHLP